MLYLFLIIACPKRWDSTLPSDGTKNHEITRPSNLIRTLAIATTINRLTANPDRGTDTAGFFQLGVGILRYRLAQGLALRERDVDGIILLVPNASLDHTFQLGDGTKQTRIHAIAIQGQVHYYPMVEGHRVTHRLRA